MGGRPTQAAQIYRPAPFAVYAPEPRRNFLVRLRQLLLTFAIVFAAFPRPVDPQGTLVVPVYYGCVELKDRSPVLLDLGLPSGEFQVSPSSLGYFVEGNRFVYTAEVARGLIYGLLGAQPVVVELRAPGEAPLYFEEHLRLIRGKVTLLNERQNLLKIARESHSSGLTSFELDPRYITALIDPRKATVPENEWLGAVCEKNGSRLLTLHSAILDEGRHSAELKRLYYEAQLARLDLILSEFDLQLAMARVPQPQIEQLVNLGDDKQIKEGMHAEIDRLRTSWKTRIDELNGAAISTQRLLRSLEPLPVQMVEVETATPTEHLHFDVGIPTLPSIETMGSYSSLDPRSELQVNLLRSRLVVAEAELEMLAASLASLDAADKHVRTGGVPDWATLPVLTQNVSRLDLAQTDTLGDLQLVEAATTSPQAASKFLLALAISFSGDARGLKTMPDDMQEYVDLDTFPNEIQYGLLAVEYELRPDAPAGELAQHPLSSPMVSKLRALVERPQQYGVARHDLGYLSFMAWYAEMVCKEYDIALEPAEGWTTHSYGISDAASGN